jgi:hypothetical protein
MASRPVHHDPRGETGSAESRSWRKSRHSAAGADAACVEATPAVLLSDGSIAVEIPGGSLFVLDPQLARPSTKSAEPWIRGTLDKSADPGDLVTREPSRNPDETDSGPRLENVEGLQGFDTVAERSSPRASDHLETHEAVSTHGASGKAVAAPGDDDETVLREQSDATHEYSESGLGLVEAVAELRGAHARLAETTLLVDGAGTSQSGQMHADAQVRVAQAERGLAAAESRFDAASDRLEELGLARPADENELEAERESEALEQADRLLGTPRTKIGTDGEVAAVREAQELVREHVAEQLRQGFPDDARELAEQFGPELFTKDSLSGGTLEVARVDQTQGFKIKSDEIKREVHAEIGNRDRALRAEIEAAQQKLTEDVARSHRGFASQARDLKAREAADQNGYRSERQTLEQQMSQLQAAMRGIHPQDFVRAQQAQQRDFELRQAWGNLEARGAAAGTHYSTERGLLEQRRRDADSGFTARRTALEARRVSAQHEVDQMRHEEPREVLRRQRDHLTAVVDSFKQQLATEQATSRFGGARPINQRDHGAYLANLPRIEFKLKKLIVEPTGHSGYHELLERNIGRHPVFGAKVHNVRVNNATELARALTGWVEAKPQRHQEKVLAEQIVADGEVGKLLDVVLWRLNNKIPTLPNADAIRRELATGRSLVEPGKPIGTYVTHSAASNRPQTRTKLSREPDTVMAVLRDPARFDLREKIMVIHDLFEYFGHDTRHTPRTHGTGLMPRETPDQAQSTTRVDERGYRVSSSLDRGQNPIVQSDGFTTKEHPSTRNEYAESTMLARERRIPVWAGQSFTSMRMFVLAEWAGASKREIGAVGYGVFTMWRLNYDHTTPFAYHTLHEVLDIAQNFGVPYSMDHQDASLVHTSLRAELRKADSLVSELSRGVAPRPEGGMHIDHNPRALKDLGQRLYGVTHDYRSPHSATGKLAAAARLLDSLEQVRDRLGLPLDPPVPRRAFPRSPHSLADGVSESGPLRLESSGPAWDGAAAVSRDPAFIAARAAAEPVRRTHTWTDPVSTIVDREGNVQYERDGAGNVVEDRSGKPVPKRFVVHSDFDVRRFEAGGQKYTDVTVKVRADGTSLSDDDLAGMWDTAGEGVERFYNEPGASLGDSGTRLHVTIERVAPGEQVDPDLAQPMTVGRAGSLREMNGNSWFPGASPVDFAHEIGHRFGVRDEYRDGRQGSGIEHRPDIPGSLFGDYRRPIDENLPRTESDPELSFQGLRDRYLRLVARIIGDVPETREAGSNERPVVTQGAAPDALNAAPESIHRPQPQPQPQPQDHVLARDAGGEALEWVRPMGPYALHVKLDESTGGVTGSLFDARLGRVVDEGVPEFVGDGLIGLAHADQKVHVYTAEDPEPRGVSWDVSGEAPMRITFNDGGVTVPGFRQKADQVLDVLRRHAELVDFMGDRPVNIRLKPSSDSGTLETPAEVSAGKQSIEVWVAEYYFKDYSTPYVLGMLAHEFGVHPMADAHENVQDEAAVFGSGVPVVIPWLSTADGGLRTLTTEPRVGGPAKQADHILVTRLNGDRFNAYQSVVLDYARLLQDNFRLGKAGSTATDVRDLLDSHLMDLATIAVTDDNRAKGLNSPGEVALVYNGYRSMLLEKLSPIDPLRDRVPEQKTKFSVVSAYLGMGFAVGGVALTNKVNAAVSDVGGRVAGFFGRIPRGGFGVRSGSLLQGGSRDAGLDPVALGLPTGGRVVVEVEPRGDRLSFVDFSEGKGKGAQDDGIYAVSANWTHLESSTSSAIGADLYQVDGSGRITLHDGVTVGETWVRHGADFIEPQTGMVLRGDSGWLGTIDNADSLFPALAEYEQYGVFEAYHLHADASNLYLVPEDPAGRAVHITGVAVAHVDPTAVHSVAAEPRQPQSPAHEVTAPRLGGAPVGLGWAHARLAQSWGLGFDPHVGTAYDALLTAGGGAILVGDHVLRDADALRQALGEHLDVAEPSDAAWSAVAEHLGASVLILHGDGTTSAHGRGPVLVLTESGHEGADPAQRWVGVPASSEGPALSGLAAAQIHWAASTGKRFAGPGGGFFDALAAAGRAAEIPELDYAPQVLRDRLAGWMGGGLTEEDWDAILGRAGIPTPHDDFTQQQVVADVRLGGGESVHLLPVLAGLHFGVGVEVVDTAGGVHTHGAPDAQRWVTLVPAAGSQENAWFTVGEVGPPLTAGAGTRPADVAGGLGWADPVVPVTAAPDHVGAEPSDAQLEWAYDHGRQLVEIPPAPDARFDAILQAVGGGFTAKGEYVDDSARLRELMAAEVKPALEQDLGLALVVHTVYAARTGSGDALIDNGRAQEEIIEAIRDPGYRPDLADELVPYFANRLGIGVRTVDPSGVVGRYGSGRPVYVTWTADQDGARHWTAAPSDASRYALGSPLRAPNRSDPALFLLNHAIEARKSALRSGGTSDFGSDPFIQQLRGAQSRWLAHGPTPRSTAGEPIADLRQPRNLDATVTRLVQSARTSIGGTGEVTDVTLRSGLHAGMAMELFDGLHPQGIGHEPGTDAAAEDGTSSPADLPADQWVVTSLPELVDRLPADGAALYLRGDRAAVVLDTADGRRLVEFGTDGVGGHVVGRVGVPTPAMEGAGDGLALIVDGGGHPLSAEQVHDTLGHDFDSAVGWSFGHGFAEAGPETGAPAGVTAPQAEWAHRHGSGFVRTEPGPNSVFDAVIKAAGGVLSARGVDVTDPVRLRQVIADHLREQTAAESLRDFPSIHAAFASEGADRIIEEFFGQDPSGANAYAVARQLEEHIGSGKANAYVVQAVAEPNHWEHVTQPIALDAIAHWSGRGVLSVDPGGQVRLHGDPDAPRLAVARPVTDTDRNGWVALTPEHMDAELFRDAAVDTVTSLKSSIPHTETGADSFYHAVLDASGGAIQIDRDTQVSTPAELKARLTTFLLDRPDVLDTATRESIERETGISAGAGVDQLIDALADPAGHEGEVVARHLIGGYLGKELKVVEPDGSEHTYGTGRPLTINSVTDEHGESRWAALPFEPRDLDLDLGHAEDGGLSTVQAERVGQTQWTPESFDLKAPDEVQAEDPWRSASFCVEIEVDGQMQKACVSVAVLTLDAELAAQLGVAMP